LRQVQWKVGEDTEETWLPPQRGDDETSRRETLSIGRIQIGCRGLHPANYHEEGHRPAMEVRTASRARRKVAGLKTREIGGECQEKRSVVRSSRESGPIRTTSCADKQLSLPEEGTW